MIRKRVWHVWDKWRRHRAIVVNRAIRKYIPPTRLLYDKAGLSRFLERNRVVFIKPVFGSFGNRIIRVARRKSDCLVQHENRIVRIPARRVYGKVRQHTKGRRFMMQRGISLIEFRGRPVDFRLLVLKPYGRWQVMGIIGKVATGNRVVTNFNHGGRPIGFTAALRAAGWSARDIAASRAELHRLGLGIARQFNRRHPHCRRMGIDIGIDRDKRIWIIEVNTNPFYELFRYHANKRLYGAIHRAMQTIRRTQSDR